MLHESKPSGIATVNIDHPPANAIGQLQTDAFSRALALVAAACSSRPMTSGGSSAMTNVSGSPCFTMKAMAG